MAFISTVPEDQAEGATKELYEKATARFGFLPNTARAFSNRPEVWQAWTGLVASIAAQMDRRRFELVTLAAAQELHSSYCMLAHGSILMRDHFSGAELETIVTDTETAELDDVDRAVMAFATLIARDATAVTQADVDRLKELGLSEDDVFDVASTAAARCYFSKTLDALGVQPDAEYRKLDASLRTALTPGRPIE